MALRRAPLPDLAGAPAPVAASAPTALPVRVPPPPPEVETVTSAPEPPREVWSADEVGPVDPARFDAVAFTPRALAGARKRWKKVDLVTLHVASVGSDGLSDLTLEDRFPVSYGFRPSGAGPSDGTTAPCSFWVVVEATRVYSVAKPLAAVCGLPEFAPAPPRCTPAGVFAKLAALDRPRPGDRADSFTFTHYVFRPPGHPWKEEVRTHWSVSGFPTFGDTGTPTDLSTDTPDDCAPAAATKPPRLPAPPTK